MRGFFHAVAVHGFSEEIAEGSPVGIVEVLLDCGPEVAVFEDVCGFVVVEAGSGLQNGNKCFAGKRGKEHDLLYGRPAAMRIALGREGAEEELMKVLLRRERGEAGEPPSYGFFMFFVVGLEGETVHEAGGKAGFKDVPSRQKWLVMLPENFPDMAKIVDFIGEMVLHSWRVVPGLVFDPERFWLDGHRHGCRRFLFLFFGLRGCCLERFGLQVFSGLLFLGLLLLDFGLQGELFFTGLRRVNFLPRFLHRFFHGFVVFVRMQAGNVIGHGVDIFTGVELFEMFFHAFIVQVGMERRKMERSSQS